MRLFIVRNPRLVLGRRPGDSPDISDSLFSFGSDIELASYITGIGNDRWANENHRIHINLEDSFKDLYDRCIAMERHMAGLRDKVLTEIKEMKEVNDEG